MAEPGVELTVVAPTYQERDDIAPLIARLDVALQGIAWQVVFVDDDSPDGTAAAVGSDRLSVINCVLSTACYQHERTRGRWAATVLS